MENPIRDFKNWDIVFKEEMEARHNIDFKNLCTYGIKPLDDALICINKNDLIVIGADSGAGKSEMAVNIARHNAQNGKRVALYYLEGGSREAMARIKWRDICDVYYKRYSKLNIPMDYRSWVVNCNIDKVIKDIEAEIYLTYKEKYKNNLLLYDSTRDLTLEDFLVSIMDFHKLVQRPYGKELSGELDVDLIIIDHLQYFSLTSGLNEITEISKILREVKKITDIHKVPIILISHLRKKGKDRGIPDQEDFYGSSNIPKISTTAITMKSANNEEDFNNGIYPTYLRIAKSRVGIKPSLAIKVNFNLFEGNYSDTYKIYRVNPGGNVATEPLEGNKLPKWYGGKNVS